jgi:short-subunit dehydrogenase
MFNNKVFLITGASSGLGRVLAYDLARKNALLVLCGRNEAELLITKQYCIALGAKASHIVADIRHQSQCEKLIEKAANEFGKIDYLILNAGNSMWDKFDEIKDLAIFENLMQTNYLANVYLIHFALPYLKQSKGSIVAISSTQAKIGVPFHSGYSASKHALEGFLDSIRQELKSFNISILNIYPSWIKGTNLRKNSTQKHNSNNDSYNVDICAQKIISAIKNQKSILYIPSYFRLVPIIKSIFPKLLDKIIAKKISKQKY